MKNILFISTYPFPIDMGSKQHAYFMLKALSLHFNVYCIFFLQPWQTLSSGSVEIPSDLKSNSYEMCYLNEHYTTDKLHNFLKKILSFPGLYMNRATHAKGLATILEYIKKYDIDVIHFEHFHYVKYAVILPAEIKKVAVYHDLHHSIFWQQMRHEKKSAEKIILALYSLKYYVFQQLLENKITAKIFLNPVEMAVLPKNAIHLPHIVNPEIKYKRPDPNSFSNVMFFGAYNHPPNRFSLKYLIDRILPKLAEKNTKLPVPHSWLKHGELSPAP